jgi:hypothetical protein
VEEVRCALLLGGGGRESFFSRRFPCNARCPFDKYNVGINVMLLIAKASLNNI